MNNIKSQNEVMEDLFILLGEKKNYEAIDLLMDHLDNLFSAGEFNTAKKLLLDLDTDKLPVIVITGILTIISHARDQLIPARENFISRAIKTLQTVHHLPQDRIENLLSRIN